MPEIAKTSHAANLKSVQKRSMKNSAKKAVGNTIKNLSLISYLDPFIDWLFGIALILAILKDILDIIGTALIALAGLGQILIFIFTFFISIFLFLIMMITGSVGKVKIARTAIKRTLLILGTAIAEIIPAVGLLPMETVLVVVAFIMTLSERRKGAQENS
jgi:hypothetical protein